MDLLVNIQVAPSLRSCGKEGRIEIRHSISLHDEQRISIPDSQSTIDGNKLLAKLRSLIVRNFTGSMLS